MSQDINKKNDQNDQIEVKYPIWLSVSEAAKIGGIKSKTIRRALQSDKLKFKIIKNRYLINFSSVIQYLTSKTKLKNKLNQQGVGQYIEKWRE